MLGDHIEGSTNLLRLPSRELVEERIGVVLSPLMDDASSFIHTALEKYGIGEEGIRVITNSHITDEEATEALLEALFKASIERISKAQELIHAASEEEYIFLLFSQPYPIVLKELRQNEVIYRFGFMNGNGKGVASDCTGSVVYKGGKFSKPNPHMRRTEGNVIFVDKLSWRRRI